MKKSFSPSRRRNQAKKQSIAVDTAISAANDCGAAYGAFAYRLGLQDRIRLTSEIKEFK